MPDSSYPIDYSEKYPENYPDEYIAGYVTFFGKKYSVSPHTLIPRLETESLVRRARQYVREHSVHTIVDIGTGSGILVLSLADMPTLQHIHALDISIDALSMAKQNGESMAKLAKQNGEDETIYTRIAYTQSDLLHTIDTGILPSVLPDTTWRSSPNAIHTSPNILPSNILSHISENIPSDTISKPHHILIVTNLPYIRAEDWENMSADTIYEPRIALFGGVHTGFEMYERLFDQISEYVQLSKQNIQKGGIYNDNCTKITMMIEYGYDQIEVAKSTVERYGWSYVLFPDHAGIYRFAEIYIN